VIVAAERGLSVVDHNGQVATGIGDRQAIYHAAIGKGIEVLELGLKLAQNGFDYRPDESHESAAERLLMRAIDKLQE